MRRLRLALPATSFACCLLICCLWLRSYGHRYTTIYTWNHRVQVGGVASDGLALVGYCRWEHVPIPHDGWLLDVDGPRDSIWSVFFRRDTRSDRPPSLRFGWLGGRDYSGSTRTVWFPLWLLVPIAATPPFVWLWRRRRKQTGTGFPVEAIAEDL